MIIAILLTAMICISCNDAESESDSKTEERSEMLSTDGIPYPVMFANYQRNSNVPVATNAKGKLLWSKKYSDMDKDTRLTPRNLLIGKENLGIRSIEELAVLDLNGKFKFSVPIAKSTPVVFGKSALANADQAFMLEYRDYNGNLLLESKDFPALDDWTTLLLFKPTWDDFLAAVQFNGGPRRLPKRFDVYSLPIEKSVRTWSFDNEGVIHHALLSKDEKTVVIVQKADVILLNISDGTEISRFGVDLEQIATLSIDLDGNLVMFGEKEIDETVRPVLEIVDFTGEQKWLYVFESPRVNQPPVSGSGGRVFLVDGIMLKCIINSELIWENELNGGEYTWLTVTANDFVVCLSGKNLSLYDQEGAELFNVEVTEEDEAFYVPVCIDSAGRLYVAGEKSLYCFQ